MSLGLDLDLADTRSQPTTDTCFPLISPDSVIVTEEEQLIDHRQTKSRILLGETDTDNHGHSWILDNSMAPENDDGCSYVPYMDNRGQGREAFQRKIRQNLEQVLESRLNGTNYLDSIEYSHGPDFFLLEHNQYLGQDQNSFTERSKYRLVYFFLNELNRKCKDLEALMLSDRLQVRHEEAGSYEEYHPHGLAFSSRAEKPHLIHEESQVNHMDSFEQIITEVLTIDVEQWAKISDEPDQILWIINSVSEVTTNLLEDIKKQSLDDNEVAYKPWLLEDEDGASVVSSGLSTGKKLSDSIQKVNSPVQPTKNVDVLSDITIFYKNKQGDNKNRKKEMRTVSTTRSQSILQE